VQQKQSELDLQEMFGLLMLHMKSIIVMAMVNGLKLMEVLNKSHVVMTELLCVATLVIKFTEDQESWAVGSTLMDQPNKLMFGITTLFLLPIHQIKSTLDVITLGFKNLVLVCTFLLVEIVMIELLVVIQATKFIITTAHYQ